VKRHIPNILTLLNLFSGLVAILFLFQQNWKMAALMVSLGIFFDFFDGLAARSLNVSSKLGLELDSLADMVTSGVVPAFVLFLLIQQATGVSVMNDFHFDLKHILPFTGFFVALGSAYRLAKFNIDERQTASFIGLPTPANALFIMALPLIIYEQDFPCLSEVLFNPYTLVIISLASTYLLNAEIPLFSLKIKGAFHWQDNLEKIVLIIISILLLIAFKYLAIPIIIMIYVFLSIVTNKLKK